MSREELVARAESIVERGWISAAKAQDLSGEFNISIDELLLELIPLAQSFSSAPQSGVEVGAVAEGATGAIYFGANLEFAKCALNQTVHAEQTSVVNAAMHGEAGLVRLAVSAPPCGHCRQFLNELPAADELQILLKGRAPLRLADCLPHAFGPADFGTGERLLTTRQHKLAWASAPPVNDACAEAAFSAAEMSYSPYTDSLAGAAVTTSDGETFAGPYLECAAFNPSLPPLQSALVMARLGRVAWEEIEQAVLVQRPDSKVDHTVAAVDVLRSLSPQISLQVLFV